MRLKISLCLFILVGFFDILNAQTTDTVVYLKPVSIISVKSDAQQITNRTEALDTSAYARLTSSSVAELLNRESGLFIKSYGAGALATVSLRGSAAAHTAVYWNGFNLQSPMHGVTDLSLIPSFLLDDVRVQCGGNGALGGSGSLGGAIHLKQNSIYGKGLSVQALSTIGSFNHLREGVAIAYGGKKFTSQTRYYHEQSKNNFLYKREYDFDKITVHQQHAAYLQDGFSQDNNFKIGKHELGIHVFYIASNKEIPALMNATTSTAEEQDYNTRIAADWKWTKDYFTLGVNGGYLTEQLNYNDSITKLFTKSNAITYNGEASLLFHPFKNHEWRISVNANKSQARADGYKHYKHRDQVNTAVSYLFNCKQRLTALVSVSKELVQGKELPFLPSIGLKYLFKKHFAIKANAASVYRLPTLNDLYWQPGGNPNLQPEKGFVSDASANFYCDKKNYSLKLEAGAFNNKINNWIIWLPNEKQVWTPDNVNKVWSRGLEATAQVDFTLNKLNFRCKGNYEYVLSTNEKVRTDVSASLNKQLIYTPRIQSKVLAAITYHGFELHYNHSYTSYRYTVSDNTEWLQPFMLAEAGLLKSFSFKHFKLDCNFTIQNVWDENYQVIAFYAMPGRHYEMGVMVRFN